MKRSSVILWFLFYVLLIDCSGKQNQPLKTPDIIETDSIAQLTSTSYQQLYIESEKRTKAIGVLKFNPSTVKASHNYNENGDSVRITLYHLEKRIIRIEKRIYIDNQEDSFVILDFDENNILFSSNRWKNSEKISYTNAILGDKLIQFNSKYEVFDLDEKHKKEIIRSTKASLDSVMQFFPEFKYTFNWENYISI